MINNFHKCKFDLAWRGPCNRECVGSYCKEHIMKCTMCNKEQATHECDFAGSLVCGRPLCKKCRCNH